MSSPATTSALPLLPVAPLDGERGYLRWKESVLLRLHTLGLAHVLSEEEEPERPGGEKQLTREDALCRGHILATLSDPLLPAYAPHATAGAVWRAVALAYDLDMGETMSRCKASAFRYDQGKPLLENLALLQGLATAGQSLGSMSVYIDETRGFPSEVVRKVRVHGPYLRMEEIWKIARKQVVGDKIWKIAQQKTGAYDGSSSSDNSRPLKRGRPQWE